MPRRRCVGCGRIAPKSELMRLVAVRERGADAALAVQDPSAIMPGRGAYLCLDPASGEPDGGCLTRASARGAFARALRCRVTSPGRA